MAPRTRKSLADLAKALGDGSIEASTSAASSKNVVPVKRAGGRPSRASTSAPSRESMSSVPTPTNYSSAGEYSTAATSSVATPSPSLGESLLGQKDTKPSAASNGLTRSGARSKIEVVFSSAKSAPPKATAAAPSKERAARNSIYSLRAPKRKREVIDDSDDEFLFDDEKNAQIARDAELARQLNEEQLAEAEMSFEDDESPPAVQSTSKSTLVTSTRSSKGARRSTRSTKAILQKGILEPDEEDDGVYEDDEDDSMLGLDESDSFEDMLPPVKKQRTAAKQVIIKKKKVILRPKAKGKVNASAPVALEDSEDDTPLMGTTHRTIGKRGKPVKAPDNNADLDSAALDSDQMWSSSLSSLSDTWDSEAEASSRPVATRRTTLAVQRRQYRNYKDKARVRKDRDRLEEAHPELKTMWQTLEKMPVLKAGMAEQPATISRQLKPFQLAGLAWMKAMEKTEWKGGLLGDEMGLGKTIQAVSLIMSDWPAKNPTLVLVPPVALMQWVSEIDSYTDGTLKTLVFHGTNSKAKNLTVSDVREYDVIMMSYNSLESMYRKQEKGFVRKDGIHKEESVVHMTHWHRVILDEAHSIKSRTSMTAKACFALKVDYRWCLSGTPLQNRIGEFFSLIRFLNIRPFACYLCKQCPCSRLEWTMDDNNKCKGCSHHAMQHVSVFNQELLNPIQKYGNKGAGAEAFKKLRLLTDRVMLRREKKDHTSSMDLPVKEIYVDRQFFGEEENDFANSIMTSGQREFDTYVAQGVMLNNYANIFGLIMQMRQVADHPDLILKKSSEGGQNIMVCCICDEPAEEAIKSRCKHDFCRSCAKSYLNSQDQPDCPQCHIPLSIDLEQPEIEQDETLVKKSSIINRIKMENWTSSSKIELLVHELHKLRSDNASHKSIIFSQFTTMLQLIEWRLRRAGITTVMLDGSMTPAQRAASIDHFMKDVEVECFLVSLKAGGVALNLTEASRVFIVDPWWNPAAEWQSADRCHRIGQTRPCTITRLCIEDSVESRIVLLQEKKANMINSTINSDDAAMESLTPEDLQFLFRGS
ncbi:DNA repair protein RAD16 [Pleurostoma richardsiae]|uniref:DNA repair protein RAD16 n=1 Tax=Pleurostoma richardsiae TaxID=41990 RepID=A0AA38RL84_9PEZI|nr:DNA repair protein RAD16 [Pleurostoma richardsiae]